MEYVQQKSFSNLWCREDGWINGYYEENNFINTTSLVKYSNFSAQMENDPEYNPQTQSNHYKSAACFWKYINDSYGADAIKNIAQAWQDTRRILPPQEKWLIKDIINPALNANLSTLIKERYSYIEE